MKSKRKKDAVDIICLGRPTAMSKLADSIPKPEGAIPSFGLPKWKTMPLESKIPMVSGPEGAYNFTRRKIGKRLWVTEPHAKFNLDDPHGHEIRFDYDPLHDTHLVPFFSKPRNLRRLIDIGAVTEDLDAKCSLRDYNAYRSYLRRVHYDRVKKQLQRDTRLAIEQRAVQYAQQQAAKEVVRIKERERLAVMRRRIIERQKLAERSRLEGQREKQERVNERLRKLTVRKLEERKALRAIRKERADTIKEKLRAAAEIRRRKIMKTLLDWSKRKQAQIKATRARIAQERERKRQVLERKWESRNAEQRMRIEREAYLFECIEENRKRFINEYNEKIRKETGRMKKLFERMKMFLKCYMTRRLPENRGKICCEKYLENGAESRGPSVAPTTRSFKSSTDTSKQPASSRREKETTEKVKKEKRLKTGPPLKSAKQPTTTKGKVIKRPTADSGDTEPEQKQKKKQKRKPKQKQIYKDVEDRSKDKLSTMDGSRQDETFSRITESSVDLASAATVKDKCRCQAIKASRKQTKKR